MLVFYRKQSVMKNEFSLQIQSNVVKWIGCQRRLIFRDLKRK